MRPTGSLVPHAKNARTHNEAQIEQIAASMQEWGWTNPVLVDEAGVILAGHGRVLAAQKLGYAEVPVMMARGWSEAQKQAYLIADNQLALNSGWDMERLKVELGDLTGAGFDVKLLGFSPEELAKISASGAVHQADPDDVPEPRPIPAAQAGDVWLLGVHRVVCGDSTDEAAVRACVGQEKPHLMVTDPPYGVEYDPNWRNSADRSTQIKGRKIGATAIGKVINDHRADWSEAWALFPGDVAYVWHAGLRAGEVQASLAAAGFEIRSQIVWNKATHIIGRGDYHWKHEPCWYAVRTGRKANFDRDGENGRKQNTVWDIPHRASDTGHGTQKPVECMRRPIVNNSKPGDAVYDPFLGSGTTLIAAEMEGRRCFGIEIDPVYVDVIIRRWEQFTGKEAVLQATGQTFKRVCDDPRPQAEAHAS